MGINSPVYAIREAVKSSLDFKETARNNAAVDRALESASRMVEGLTHRKFYPEVDTRYFDWPDTDRSLPWRLWLDANEVISISILTVAGTVIPSSDYFLEPANYGPPFNRIEIDLADNSSFQAGQTHQRAIQVDGVFGYTNDEALRTDLDEALDNSETGVDIHDSSGVGVGALIRIDNERMLVTDKTSLDTTVDTTSTLDANMSTVTVPVTNGSLLFVGEVILIDSERMLVLDVAGNNLVVKRAWDGTVLSAHNTAASIFVQRSLTVVRGFLGTTAATHADNASVWTVEPPGLIRDLTIAEAVNQLLQESSGYARVVGSGEGQIEASGKGLAALRTDVQTRYGRQVRVRAI